jgi:hypothetical protein
MEWIINILKKVFGHSATYGIVLIVIGIVVMQNLPKYFVTVPILAQELRPLKRADIDSDIKMIEFQRTQILIRKNDLEDKIDEQGGMPSQRQQGRLQELIVEATDLKNKITTLERDLKDCQ